MALTDDVVVGSVALQGNDYPIYGTEARAREYFIASLGGTTFTGAGSSLQKQALVSSRRLIDRQKFTVGPLTEAQITAFPQVGSTDSTVPLDVEIAQYELARALILRPALFNTSDTGSNRKRIKAGSVEIENFSSTTGANSIGGGASLFPPQVQDLLGPFLASRVTLTIPFAGGTKNASNVIPRVGNDISDGL